MNAPRTYKLGPLHYAKKYAPKLLRLTAFLALLYAALMVTLGYRVRAQVSESFMSMGAEMLTYEGADHQSAPRTLELNGQAIKLATGRAPHSLAHVLDYYESRCMQRDGRFAEQIAEITEGDPQFVLERSRMLDPTMREEDGHKGFVACLDTLSDERLEVEGFAERARRFQSSLDLSDIGELRYVYGEEHDGHTFFVAFWVEGSFKVLDMFPTDRDVPGRDVDDVPRTSSSRRILSAWEEGHPESVTAYVDPARDAHALLRYYRHEMPHHGWEELPLDRDISGRLGISGPPDNVLVFEQDDRMIGAVFGTNDDGMGTTTILQQR